MPATTYMIIDGEGYLTLEGVAECYQCEHAWVREVYEFGLIGRGRIYEGRIVVLSSMLDRVAEIRRLHVYQGVHLTAVAALLRF